ncbi:PREDICTED: zinc finger MYND domain-containing protein 15 [Ipomoea nil]|uniref:zinc finger MYND domain-containing protein 15 n=1 Tax=Ipomoea nil TaxID=35883 RepID=UPI00090086A9|nr:PREDICTED: zinc finger MYND domain-containing protein 15 [Ipomoea nil]XP_019158092.1 PREDICTED: zinc finger MYND domain-containing protein 15 [Ipomoea nil]
MQRQCDGQVSIVFAGRRMECAGKGSRTPCSGQATRRCGRCRAVAYCSISHQVSHWSVHKKECERLEQQMNRADVLSDFPFTFTEEATVKVCEQSQSRCSFLVTQGVHCVGMWTWECGCGASVASLDVSRYIEGWNLSNTLCPCRGPSLPIPKRISNWKEYYEWRCIPLNSPVALLLHWPLTIYWGIQLAIMRSLISEIASEIHIHYIGPEKELYQLAVFGELCALFPGVRMHIYFVGNAVPQDRDGEVIALHSYCHCIETDCECKSLNINVDSCSSMDKSCPVMLHLCAGYYHDRYKDLSKDSSPNLIIAPNAGIAAYRSWLPTIELIMEMKVPALFSDYCEEAAHLATHCISSISSSPPSIPIQLNPFRQPLAVEDSALFLPCYSNCFLFGM